MNRKQLLEKILSFMDAQIPQLNKKNFISNEMSKAVFGKIPSYSSRKNYHILPVNTATLSSFIICYHKNKIVTIRKKSISHKTHFLGFLGGFVNIDKKIKETPIAAAIREFGEECCDEKAIPLINLYPSRLKIINVYIDYTKVELDLTPTLNVAYQLELTKDEFQQIKRHMEKMCTDKKYAKSIFNSTNKEIFAFNISKITDLLQKEKAFAHKNEFIALKEFYQKEYL